MMQWINDNNNSEDIDNNSERGSDRGSGNKGRRREIAERGLALIALYCSTGVSTGVFSTYDNQKNEKVENNEKNQVNSNNSNNNSDEKNKESNVNTIDSSTYTTSVSTDKARTSVSTVQATTLPRRHLLRISHFNR